MVLTLSGRLPFVWQRHISDGETAVSCPWLTRGCTQNLTASQPRQRTASETALGGERTDHTRRCWVRTEWKMGRKHGVGAESRTGERAGRRGQPLIASPSNGLAFQLRRQGLDAGGATALGISRKHANHDSFATGGRTQIKKRTEPEIGSGKGKEALRKSQQTSKRGPGRAGRDPCRRRATSLGLMVSNNAHLPLRWAGLWGRQQGQRRSRLRHSAGLGRKHQKLSVQASPTHTSCAAPSRLLNPSEPTASSSAWRRSHIYGRSRAGTRGCRLCAAPTPPQPTLYFLRNPRP